MTFRRFMLSQGLIMMASSMIFPFYVLLLRNVGDSYSQFGWAYGLFALTAALSYPLIGRFSDKLGDQTLLQIYCWSMACLLLFFPIVTEVWQIYMLQVLMGFLGAVQKNTEKTSLARSVEKKSAGQEIGTYHLWTSVGAAIAIILTGYLVDFITIGSIFYLASFIYVISALVLFRRKKINLKNSQSFSSDL
ncbi:MFS transporter [Litchfieldia alkalitelluris]|uniref:MFS transporter n=1 Tax=Litchfieldia alkalitelluris TaxID=304268 RepID=UPI0009974279|nr:MFS transporter [Litchfieldia alkalitelluris]